MNIINKLRNMWRGCRQRWGTSGMKRQLWNREFENGRWDSIKNTPGDVVYSYVERYSRGGSILDLGCGSGNTACELDAESYSKYTGVDISDVAIEMARQRSERGEADRRNRYVQSDIANYVPKERHDVILFRESIYYIPRTRIKATLERYSGFLKPNGVLIVRWHDAHAARDLLTLIGGGLKVVDRSESIEGPVVFVLRPPV